MRDHVIGANLWTNIKQFNLNALFNSNLSIKQAFLQSKVTLSNILTQVQKNQFRYIHLLSVLNHPQKDKNFYQTNVLGLCGQERHLAGKNNIQTYSTQPSTSKICGIKLGEKRGFCMKSKFFKFPLLKYKYSVIMKYRNKYWQDMHIFV